MLDLEYPCCVDVYVSHGGDNLPLTSEVPEIDLCSFYRILLTVFAIPNRFKIDHFYTFVHPQQSYYPIGTVLEIYLFFSIHWLSDIVTLWQILDIVTIFSIPNSKCCACLACSSYCLMTTCPEVVTVSDNQCIFPLLVTFSSKHCSSLNKISSHSGPPTTSWRRTGGRTWGTAWRSWRTSCRWAQTARGTPRLGSWTRPNISLRWVRGQMLQCDNYRVGRPICRRVLKIMFWEVHPADWLIL